VTPGEPSRRRPVQPLSALVVEALDHGVVVIDREERAVLVNPAARGMGILDVDTLSFPGLIGIVREAFETGEHVTASVDLPIVRLGREPIALAVTAVPLPGSDERIAAVEAKGMEPMVEPTVARWFTPKFIETRKDVVEPVRTMIRRTPAKGYVGCCHAIKPLDLTDRLKAITLPTLIIVGAQDMGTPLAASQAINQQIKGSELVVLDPASHLSNLEQPAAFTQALEVFLKRVA